MGGSGTRAQTASHLVGRSVQVGIPTDSTSESRSFFLLYFRFATNVSLYQLSLNCGSDRDRIGPDRVYEDSSRRTSCFWAHCDFATGKHHGGKHI